MTHGALVFGIVLYFTCSLLYRKQFKHLLACAAAYLAGLAVVTAPMLLWFAAKDALWDMIYGTFIVPFAYAGNGILTRSQDGWKQVAIHMLPILITAAAVLFTRSFRKPLGRFILCCSVISAAALIPGEVYAHYYILVTPYVTLGTILACSCMRQREKGSPMRWTVMVALSACMLLLAVASYKVNANIVRRVFDQSGWRSYISAENQDFLELGSLIPDNERDRVLAYATMWSAQWYNINDILPCYRYCMSAFMLSVPEIMDEYAQMLDQDPPLWYFVGSSVPESQLSFDMMVANALAEKYEFIAHSESGFDLYRLKTVG